MLLSTHLDEGQVGDNLRTALGAHLATRQLELEVGQLRPWVDVGEVGHQQQVLVVEHLLVGRIHPWAEVQLLKTDEQGQCDVKEEDMM